MNNLGPLPKVLDYDLALDAAEHELHGFLIDLRKKHGLTQSQELNILATRLQSKLRYICRDEREKSK